MRASQTYINTLKEVPAEAQLISHQLMLKAGLIKRLSSGIYTWLPLGLKILKKIEAIIRQEVNKVGAQEILMPNIQPKELWQESGRWEFYGSDLLRLKDRHNRDFCFGPTHEEVVVDLIRHEIKSYKQLPIILYQIQNKFRDEIRPRFGVMRAREFIMKDAYSFHSDYESLCTTYNNMKTAYCNIFERIGLNYKVVNADTGSIGGDNSHEFQALSNSGEDVIAYSSESNYAANLEKAEYGLISTIRLKPTLELKKVATPNQKSCTNVAQFLNLDINKIVKTLVYLGKNNEKILVLIRGDRTINQIKLSKLNLLKEPLQLIDLTKDQNAGYVGPVGFNGIIICDLEVSYMSDFACGANLENYHLTGANFVRDIKEPIIANISNVVAGDLSPDGYGVLKLARGIELGHIFQLRDKYSSPMNLQVLDKNGKAQTVEMGCYGIGVSRIIGALIEQNNDEKGIKFPINVAPFEVVIIPINYNKANISRFTEKLYNELISFGIDTLLDDRKNSIGFLLNDSDLLGICYRIVINEKNLTNNLVELYNRHTQETKLISITDVAKYLHEKIRI